MTHQERLVAAPEGRTIPPIRSIGMTDIGEALARGFDDFRAMPTHAIFLSLLYPVVGLLLGRLTMGYDVLPLLYPIAAGFALIGPFAAIWLYELSRRREQGLDVSWRHAFDVLYSPSFKSILALGAVLMILFLVWLATAHAIYVATFGYGGPTSVTDFARQIFTTDAGRTLIVVGNGVGFLFALVAFTLSVVSFPLLVDRNVGATAAMLTSVEVVLKNPITMAAWGLIVAASLLIGSLPFLFGLAVVMPVLGHATWHLYRRAVEPNPDGVAEHAPRPQPQRFAADFPASLFPSRGEKQ